MNGRTSVAILVARTAASLMTVASPALGHGVRHRVFPGGTGIEATYDDGSPMAYCDVTVFSPGSRDGEYQTGTTDAHGRFAFIPDTNGLWTLTVDDGMGHLVSAEVQAGPSESPGGEGARIDRLRGGIVGLSMIFGVFGIYCLARQRMDQTKRKARRLHGDNSCTSPKV